MDRRYNLTETAAADIAEDGDEVLFDFINQYLEKKDNGGHDFESLIFHFHKIKGQFLRLIMSKTPGIIPVERVQDRLLIMTRDKKQKSVFRKTYIENFLPRLRETSAYPIDVLTHNGDLIAYLKGKSEESRHEPIRQFADAEIQMLHEQNLFLTILNTDVTRLVVTHRIYLPNIPVIDLPGLRFLSSPFPAMIPRR
jgi:hypothetical protein